jgi:hypothetical protein
MRGNRQSRANPLKFMPERVDNLPATLALFALLPFPSMATRLLSFLNDVEQAVISQSASTGQSWVTSRLVNYHNGLARLTLTPSGSDPAQMRGAILIQSFELADGSHCSKASLNWQGIDASPVLSVYAKPGTDWKAEAARIAGVWLTGGAPSQAPAETTELSPLVAQAG